MHLGIDPGFLGAVAVLAADGALVDVYDTPTLLLATRRGAKLDYDLPGMANLLLPYLMTGVHVVLEHSQAMPGQGVRSTWSTGYGYGVWVALLAGAQLPYTTVRPHLWKRALGLGKDKEQARLRAIQLYPAADLRRKKDHGRAEALLLAYWGWQHYTSGDAGKDQSGRTTKMLQ